MPPPVRQALPFIHLMGIPIHALTESEVVRWIVSELRANRGGWVVTPNLDHMRRLRSDESFRKICSGATLLVPDGTPLLWASRLQRSPLPERVAGSDLVSSLSAALAQEPKSLFLLGGDPGTADETAAELRRRHPDLEIVGTLCPEVGFEQNPAEFARIKRTVAAAKPSVVFVALGSPKQERLISELAHLLPETWWLGVGISFSFLAGRIRRAPHWMRKSGLEWCHRLSQEPRRLASRYLWHGVPFACRLLSASAWSGLKSALPGRGRPDMSRANEGAPGYRNGTVLNGLRDQGSRSVTVGVDGGPGPRSSINGRDHREDRSVG